MTAKGYEDAEQIALFQWARLQARAWPELALLHHIPNGGYRIPAEAKRLQAMGVRAGVPDLCLPVPRGCYHGLYIEMKRTDGGRVRPDQRGWLDALREQGFRAEVCHGFDEARICIEEYMREGAYHGA